MSPGKWDCARCGTDAEGSGYSWSGPGAYRLCRPCGLTLAQLAGSALGIEVTGSEYGVEIGWAELSGWLDRFAREPVMLISRWEAVLTDLDRYAASNSSGG